MNAILLSIRTIQDQSTIKTISNMSRYRWTCRPHSLDLAWEREDPSSKHDTHKEESDNGQNNDMTFSSAGRDCHSKTPIKSGIVQRHILIVVRRFLKIISKVTQLTSLNRSISSWFSNCFRRAWLLSRRVTFCWRNCAISICKVTICCSRAIDW